MPLTGSMRLGLFEVCLQLCSLFLQPCDMNVMWLFGRWTETSSRRMSGICLVSSSLSPSRFDLVGHVLPLLHKPGMWLKEKRHHNTHQYVKLLLQDLHESGLCISSSAAALSASLTSSSWRSLAFHVYMQELSPPLHICMLKTHHAAPRPSADASSNAERSEDIRQAVKSVWPDALKLDLQLHRLALCVSPLRDFSLGLFLVGNHQTRTRVRKAGSEDPLVLGNSSWQIPVLQTFGNAQNKWEHVSWMCIRGCPVAVRE